VPLIAALEALKQAPQDQTLLDRVEKAFNELNILQGAALTYAPIWVCCCRAIRLVMTSPHFSPGGVEH
jgi:hypothetical protein